MPQALPSLPPLRETIARHGLSARKALGQHFLLDLNLTGRIARAAQGTGGPLQEGTVIEVGSGPGGLTRALLAAGAHRLVAIEKDQRCLAALAELAAAYPDSLQVVEGDALEIDAATLGPAPRKIVANLPYNVATPLLIGWLAALRRDPAAFASLTLMFQKEVALRLIAAPGGKDYGRLSVMTQWLTAVRLLFDVPARAFTPPPKVTSSVVQLVPRPAEPDMPAFATMERVVGAAFGQRRKMLRQSLKALGGDPLPLLANVGIDETARAEQLTVAQFCALAKAFETAAGA
ncbi:MAG: 16S rRNA (adenine(1518)-N(6)/adenine(1519)-N(6))-dimethyltransferase RsmA [Kiloniellales bacterium]